MAAQPRPPTCQHKDGCTTPAIYTVTAEIGGSTHSRFLCEAHARDALLLSGKAFINERLTARHGRFRTANIHSKFIPPTRYSMHRFKPYKTLRVAVAVDSPLVLGDRINVITRSDTRYDWSVTWGSAPLVKNLGKRWHYYDNKGEKIVFRYAYIDYPENWPIIYGRIVATPLA
jgi:hypothetical protein